MEGRPQHGGRLSEETSTTLEVEELVATEFERISEIARKYPEGKITVLAHYLNETNLKTSHREMDGKKANGVDDVTKEEYERNLDENLRELVERMKKQSYKPQPVRRTYIPKETKGEMRPLGIPAYEDKLVQSNLNKILVSIYETEFLDCSYGFRPGRSCHDAIKALDSILSRKVNYVVDADIKSFFSHVNHEWMMKFLERRIGDPSIIRLVYRFLKSGVMEEGEVHATEEGTPQGGIISPTLANVYLHYVLDIWFEKIVKKYSDGEAYLIRYADDFVCCFQYKEDAERFYKALIERLSKFGLELAIEKSKIIEFGRFAEENREKRGEDKPETFDFLGFTHYCSKSRNGKFRVKRKTSKKKFRASLKRMKMWLKRNMHEPVKNLIEGVNAKLRGHFNYYGITDNSKALADYRYIIRKMLFKALRRRGQKKRLTWDRYANILKRHPLVNPKIVFSLYS